jgi:hypothetical protein
MKLEREVARKITRDVLISIFLYALPVLLMFITFYFTGQKPWQTKTIQTELKK